MRIPRSPKFNNTLPLGIFDGASQDVGLNCGDGSVSKLNESKSYQLKMGCGSGKNT